MAFSRDIPVYVARIRHQNGSEVLIPLSEPNSLRVDTDISLISFSMADALQKKQIDNGSYQAVLDHVEDEGIETGKVVVEFDAADRKSNLVHPELNLEFEYYSQKVERGIRAGVPCLGIEAFVGKEEDLEKVIIQSIQLEFARKNRFQSLHSVLSAIWFDGLELERTTLSLTFFTPSELSNLNSESNQELLPTVAQKLIIQKQQAFHREEELEQLIRTLKSQFSRNLLLVGPAGSGKTALVWELARVANARGISFGIWETTASTMIKELTTDLGWQANLPLLCREIARKGDILYIRNLLELFEVGQYEGNSVSMAEFLRDYIARGEVTLISECTDEEFARIEMRSPNYLSLFQIVKLNEPEKHLNQIIEKKLRQLSLLRGVHLEKEAVLETVRLQKRYSPYSGFPGKPIRFLETLILNKFKESSINKELYIRKKEVISHFSEEAGMPQFMIDPEIPMDLDLTRSFFQNNIFGQKVAVKSVVDLLASVKTALTRQGKPIASFLFVGPTGVGKTEMAKVLAEFMFSKRERMIRFDMSEYSNAWAVQRLTGESYFQEGTLTSAVRREPFCVLLFDEIEKAHPLFYDLLLQLLSEGRLTDSRGKLVNFCSSIIIMTSNIGAANLQSDRIGWNHDLDIDEVNTHFISAVEKHFRPELYNRIDKIVPFEPISESVVENVIQREIALLRKREGILHRKIDLLIKPAVISFLAENGYDPKYGARKIQRTIHEFIIIPLANKLNHYDYDDQLIVEIIMEGKQPAVNIESDPLKIDLLLEELARLEWTEYVSSQRRNINQLKDGRFFIQLLSKLDLLEREKRKQKERFWLNEKSALKYAGYNEISTRVQALSRRVEDFELELAITGMGLRHYDTTIIERTKEWEKQYLDLKLDLYSQISAQGEIAYLGIYSSQLPAFFPIFHKVLEEKNFQIFPEMLWYRESYYNEAVTVTEEYLEYHDYLDRRMVNVGDKMERQEYIRIPVDAAGKDDPYSPPQEGDKLVGVQIIVRGKAAYMYLEGEKGLMKWKSKKEDNKVAYITPSLEDRVEYDIHRKNFYQRHKLLRTFQDDHLQDTSLGINREVTRQLDHADLIRNGLDARFSEKLDKALL